MTRDRRNGWQCLWCYEMTEEERAQDKRDELAEQILLQRMAAITRREANG